MAQGLMLKTGTLVVNTLIGTQISTKNSRGERDLGAGQEHLQAGDAVFDEQPVNG